MGAREANRVRRVREERGVSQGHLAELASLSRQSVGAIEAGRAVPGVDVALRIAGALGCRVEELFGGAPETVETTPAVASGRVALAHIGGRWVSLPLGGDGLRVSADGVVTASRGTSSTVEPMRPLAEALQNLVVMGCAVALGLLADRLNGRGAGRFLWFASSSGAALGALARGETHIAGVHLADTGSGDANVGDVRRLGMRETTALVTLARWEAGLVTAGGADAVRSVADLAQPGVRLVGREGGAGAQRLLERELEAAGLPTALANTPLRAPGHLEVARTVAMGAADVGVATRDAAMAFGLRFVPLAEERYDLVLPRSLLADGRVVRLLDALVSAPVRRELAALGYDMTETGRCVAEVEAA